MPDDALCTAALDGAADFFSNGQSNAVDIILFRICTHQNVLFIIGQDINRNGCGDRFLAFLYAFEYR